MIPRYIPYGQCRKYIINPRIPSRNKQSSLLVWHSLIRNPSPQKGNKGRLGDLQNFGFTKPLQSSCGVRAKPPIAPETKTVSLAGNLPYNIL